MTGHNPGAQPNDGDNSEEGGSCERPVASYVHAGRGDRVWRSYESSVNLLLNQLAVEGNRKVGPGYDFPGRWPGSRQTVPPIGIAALILFSLCVRMSEGANCLDTVGGSGNKSEKFFSGLLVFTEGADHLRW